jgi:hypothetical protein
MARSVRGRNFLGVVYPDSESYDCSEVLNKLSGFKDYAYILHDLDVDENGELKKPHYHWLVSYGEVTTLSNVAKLLGVPENSVEVCRSYRATLLYMVHLSSPDKHQYSIDELQGNYKRSIFDSSSEKLLVSSCLAKIQAGEIRSIQGLAAYAAQTDDWPSFRRNYSILKDLLHEYITTSDSSQVGGWHGDKRSFAPDITLDSSGAIQGFFDS